MKNKAIAVLKSNSVGEDHYKELIALVQDKMSPLELRGYLVGGFSQFKYDRLILKVREIFEISNLDLHLFKAPEVEINKSDLSPIKITGNSSQGNSDEQINADTFNVEAMIKELDKNKDAKDGLKLRIEYPFLNSSDCPDEFHILVGQRITAWNEYVKTHEELSKFLETEQNHEKLYELCEKAIENFQLNADMKAELDFFKETGKILGKISAMVPLKIKQEIYEMSEAELVKHRTNAKKSISKYSKMEDKKELLKTWKWRLELVDKRLTEEFNHELK